MQLYGLHCKSYQINHSRWKRIVEFNYYVLLTYLEASLRSKRFKRDFRATSHIRHEIYFWSYLKIKYCFVCSNFVKRSHILKVVLDRFSCFDYLTDYHIEERRKIKVDEIHQALAKGRCVTVAIFCIFVTLYTKTELTKQSEKFS